MQDKRQDQQQAKQQRQEPSQESSQESSQEHLFDSLAHSWWDREGTFSMLHKLQPVRMRYLRERLSRHFATPDKPDAASPKLRGLRVLDIGCGGGLLSESLARLGFEVIGIDSSLSSINIARAHASEFLPEHQHNERAKGQDDSGRVGGRASFLPISYHHASLSDFAKQQPSPPRFDFICALEVIEHTDDPQEFLELASRLLRPNGFLLLSTLNRTFESWLKGIVAAEYILGLVPRATHDWSRFITPLELESMAAGAGLRIDDFCGMRYRPLRGDFVLDKRSLSFNYIASASKRDD